MTVGSAAGRNSPSVVEARAVMATDAAYPGSEAKVAVVAQVAAGFHINDHHPSLDYLIPTELKLDGAEQIGVESVVYPKGQQQRFAFSETALSVYEGTVVVTAVLKIARTVRLGLHTIRGKFAYQACNDHACLPPETVPLALTVKIVPRSVPLKRQNADVFDKIKLD
jgi:DsbC/DsbD-like thiol-disulfide interchange protein